jgi:hypothetical protein
MDFADIKTGDIEPLLGKKVKEIIECSNTFIVYMDEDDIIQWAAAGHGQLGENFGDIQNQISYWESISNKVFSKEESYDYKGLLAEGYARMLGEGNHETAQRIIDQIIDRIKKHGGEVLRQQYLLSSLVATGLTVLILMLTIFFKQYLLGFLGYSVYEVFLASLFGGIGAFVSTMTRSKNYSSEITVGKRIHKIDGILRIVYGVIAGAVVAIGIKSNIVFGFVNEIPKSIFVMAFLGAMGGASEMIIPSIIKQIEGKT